ncbi:unnamed protein product, partial [Prorocentrum cordatum]
EDQGSARACARTLPSPLSCSRPSPATGWPRPPVLPGACRLGPRVVRRWWSPPDVADPSGWRGMLLLAALAAVATLPPAAGNAFFGSLHSNFVVNLDLEPSPPGGGEEALGGESHVIALAG